MNIGHGRILSSGTAGAGMEAAIDGIKAISSSLYIPPEIDKVIDYYDTKNYGIYENSAEITTKIVKILFNKSLTEDIDLISINMLNTATVNDNFEITRLDRQLYGKLFHKKGNSFIHKNPTLDLNSTVSGTDTFALKNNTISITPISLDLTSKKSKEMLNDMIKNEW